MATDVQQYSFFVLDMMRRRCLVDDKEVVELLHSSIPVFLISRGTTMTRIWVPLMILPE